MLSPPQEPSTSLGQKKTAYRSSAPTSPAAPRTASLTFLPALPGSGGYSYATGLNNLDQIVGYSSGGIPGPFFWSASTGILELPAPLGSFAAGVATGISDDGIVPINVATYNGPDRSYFWSKATGSKFFPTLPGDAHTSANGVNRFGQIVGTSSSAARATGVIWDHEQTPQVPPASDNPLAFFLISNAGHIAGRNLVYTPGQGFVELSAPDNATTLAPAIIGVNASGYAVGARPGRRHSQAGVEHPDRLEFQRKPLRRKFTLQRRRTTGVPRHLPGQQPGDLHRVAGFQRDFHSQTGMRGGFAIDRMLGGAATPVAEALKARWP
jgi:hypothetical protein